MQKGSPRSACTSLLSGTTTQAVMLVVLAALVSAGSDATQGKSSLTLNSSTPDARAPGPPIRGKAHHNPHRQPLVAPLHNRVDHAGGSHFVKSLVCLTWIGVLVPEMGLEPIRGNNPSPDFKSGVSAISPLWLKKRC